jgi:hypothetical protein
VRGILVEFEVERLLMSDDNKKKNGIMFFIRKISPSSQSDIRHLNLYLLHGLAQL